MDLKFFRKDLLVVVIVLALTPLVMFAYEMPFGSSLFFLCFMLGFFSLFGYVWMFYDQGRHNVVSFKTFSAYKAYLPKFFLIIAVLTVIGFILALLRV